MRITLTVRQGDRSMHTAVALPFLSLDGPAEQPDELVTDVDDAMEENPRSVSR